MQINLNLYKLNIKKQMKAQQSPLGKPQVKSLTHSKRNYQYLWRGVFLFISIASAILINKIYIYQTSDFFMSVKKGVLSQLVYFGIPFGILFVLSDSVVHWLLDQKCVKYYINQEKYKTQEARKKRAYTLVKWAYSLLYYGTSSILGYFLVQQTTFMPTWLGGNGYCTDLTRYVLTFDQATFGMKVFYILQFGKHLGRFFQHVFIRSEGNFYEYALHHGLSTFLIFFSYLMNMWLIGIFVLLIHDTSDFFLILARAYRDYKYLNKKVIQIFYGMAIVSWIFCRIFLLSFCCVYSSISTSYELYTKGVQTNSDFVVGVFFYPGSFMAFMLFALQILQLFWTYYIASSFIEVSVSSNLAKHTYD